MPNELDPQLDPGRPMVYQIRIEGHLGCQWTDWFEGLTITLEEDGKTLLSGPVADQAALYGLLKKVRDLGMPLVSINRVQFNETHPYRSKKETKMNTHKMTAIAVGVLYITGTVTGILSVVFTKSVLDAPDYLNKIAANGNPIITGALLVLMMGLALAMVPVVMFPILKRHHEVLALGYVVFRGGLETVTYIAVVISFLLLVSLSQAAVRSGASDAVSFQALGALVLKAHEISATTTEIVFPMGALMFYTVLYQSKLIPRWISGWGLIAVILHLTSGLLHMFGLIGQMSTIQTVLALPIALQEMVLAVWLIVKGFNPSAVASRSAKTDMN